MAEVGTASTISLSLADYAAILASPMPSGLSIRVKSQTNTAFCPRFGSTISSRLCGNRHALLSDRVLTLAALERANADALGRDDVQGLCRRAASIQRDLRLSNKAFRGRRGLVGPFTICRSRLAPDATKLLLEFLG